MPAVNPGTTGLVAWWSLDEASGQRNDSHGTNTLTDVNTVLSAAGKVSNAADFERSNSERLTINDNASLSMGVGVDMTICAWIKQESQGTFQGIVSKASSFTTAAIEWRTMVDNGNALLFQVSTGAAAYSLDPAGAAITVNTWHFVAFWLDTAVPRMYCQVDNGTIYDAASDYAQDAGGALFVGNTDGGSSNWFDGLIDEVCIYKRALSDDERTWLYNAGAGRAYADLSPGNPVAIIQQQHWRSVWAGGVPVG